MSNQAVSTQQVSAHGLGSREVPALADGDSAEELDELQQLLRDSIEHDENLQRLLALEDVTEDEVLREGRELLVERRAELVGSLRALRSAAERRGQGVSAFDTATGEIMLGLLGLAFMVTAAWLAVLTVAKWLGFLVPLSYLPWVFLPLGLLGAIVLASVVMGVIDSVRRDNLGDRSVEYQRAREDLQEALHTLVVVPALERATQPNLDDPSDDVVEATQTPGLLTHVEPWRRIETASYRRTLAYLRRPGGAVVGLAGTRGVGKSELLRHFCRPESDGQSPADLADGWSRPGVRTVGVLVPAPTTSEPQAFLRVLIRRLCQQVPYYKAEAVERPVTGLTRTRVVLSVLAAISLLAGLAILLNWRLPSQRTLGWVLAVSGLVALSALASRWASKRRLARRWPPSYPALRHGGLSRDRAELAEMGTKRYVIRRQHEAARAAEKTARRVRFAESRSTGAEAALNVWKLGGKVTSSIGLTSLPLTEVDLISELEDLVAVLDRCGYRVIIGIDELDKLPADERAEQFLNSLKALFPIQSASFLISISEDAWTRFVRRGLPMRDVFDSSLDTVVLVERLSFAESRSFIRRRPERMTDTEVLLCHCLSGGLPRDLLRFARRLGEINYDLGGHRRLDELARRLLTEELCSTVEAALREVRSGQSGPRSLALLAELEGLGRLSPTDDCGPVLQEFLASDPEFARLAVPGAGPRPGAATAGIDETSTNIRREVYTYLHFLAVVDRAFRAGGPLASLPAHDGRDVLAVFETLARARQRIEVDATAGWRTLVEVQARMGSSPVVVHRRGLRLPVVRVGGAPPLHGRRRRLAGREDWILRAGRAVPGVTPSADGSPLRRRPGTVRATGVDGAPVWPSP